ncbi:MAG: dicarboxylate/amino acid:cation symporter [Thermoanaerobaculales bacterium]|nr:dicarboxylate/amino acid:cation symporter [Thermoanaerobaculales bacterium]
MSWWFRQQLYFQIVICIAIGIALGLLLGPKALVLEPVGEIFIRLLKMLIVPLTFFTLISGVTKMDDLRNLRSVGGMTVLYYAVSSALACTIGTVLALILQPGRGIQGLLESTKVATPEEFSFVDSIVSWIPTNPIEAAATGNMLQIIVFSLIVGLGLLALREKAKDVIKLFAVGADLMITITEFVMKLAPYGILALVACMVATLGVDMLAAVVRFVVTDYLGLAVVLFLVYPLLLRTLAKVNPIRFYRNVSPAMLVAASTTSSSATLPVSMGVAEKNLGVSEKVYGFTLPLGATINMDGMAVVIGVIAVFASNVYNEPITLARIIQFVFLGLVLSIGTAGIKGAGIVISTVLLQTLGLPLTIVPILASIWPVIDIGHTACNVSGDLCGTTIVASRLKIMDAAVFNDGTSNQDTFRRS